MVKSLKMIGKQLSRWHNRTFTRIYVWLNDKPPPLPHDPWRFIYWREEGRWTVYVFRGRHWRGAGFHLKSLSAAVEAAKIEVRRTMKDRRKLRRARWQRISN